MSVCVCVVTVSIARQHFENSSPRALRDGPYRFLCIPMTDQNDAPTFFAWRRVCLCIQKHKMHARRWSAARCPSPCMHSGTSEAIARGSVCSECWPSCINVVFCACMNNGRFKRCAASLHCNTIVHGCRSVETTNIRLCRKRTYCN